ncbi:hypothetical protein [Geomicrobium sp. JCM 19039]|uniref:hypothetical protein n=1 Tax=Geomicrobium sp. JCM 19039 TaxID=1460636 RepID=UPI00045F21FA|nr:hypothetical protein [Geomicrobium sp. JCM 19039]GAK14720.1 hypothetical protein JCM19039_4661 [Geomicrobium sp. JCM 19039]
MSLKTFENITMVVMVLILVLLITGAITPPVSFYFLGVIVLIVITNFFWRLRDYKNEER